MKLVFRLGGIGFSLPIESLAEIKENVSEVPDSTLCDASGKLAGKLSFRGEEIPIYDLRRLFDLETSVTEERGVLILWGGDGPWGIFVERVEGIYPVEDFASRPVSVLFSRPHESPYEYVDVWREEPLVFCDVPRLERLLGRP